MGRTVGGMDIDWTHELVDQLEFHWGKTCALGSASLTDEQYLWEPVPGCWSVRRAARIAGTTRRSVPATR